MSKNSSCSEHAQTIGITIELDAKSNQLLTLSARRSNRPKRQEAKIRLQDHLKEFESISALGNVTRRKEDK